MSETCSTCMFVRIDPATDESRCHRYPPTSFRMSVGFPVVQHSDWCGEHRPKV